MEQSTIITQVVFTREKNSELLSTGFVPTFNENFVEHGIVLPQNFFDPTTKVVLKIAQTQPTK